MEGADVLDSPVAGDVQDPAQLARIEKARQANLGMGAALLVQFVLGSVVALYVAVPPHDGLGGAFTSPPALAAHAGFGVLLLGGLVQVLVRALQLRRTSVTVLAVANAVAVAGAAVSGAAFVGSAANAASLAMAALTAVALLCSLLSLYLLGPRPAAAG